MELANNQERRLLGIVRFYDQDRGFGFIDTNGYGIDKPDSVNKVVDKELFFCYRDIKSDLPFLFYEGVWVTFVYKKSYEQKRDFAKQVKLLRHNRNEFSLALQYQGIYASILGHDVIKSIAEELLEENRETTFVLGSLFQLYENRVRDNGFDSFVLQYFGQGVVFDLLFDEATIEVISPDISVYGSIIFHLSVAFFDINNPTLFSRCIPRLTAEGTVDIRDYICSRFSTHDFSKSFLRKIPIDVICLLFQSDSSSYPAEISMIVYERCKDSSFLLHDSLIEYWNEHGLSLVSGIPGSVADYIATSPLSSEKLLLETFLKTSNQKCLIRVKDLSIFYTWLPYQKNLIYDYIHQVCSNNVQSHLSEQLLEQSLRVIGLDNIERYVSVSKANCLPKALMINLFVSVTIRSEIQKDEVHTYGGHWTWDEGMKGEESEILTYLHKEYDAEVFIEASKHSFVLPYLQDFKEGLRSHLDNGVVESIFAFSFQYRCDYLVSITLQDSSQNNYVRLFAINGLHEKILLTPSNHLW